MPLLDAATSPWAPAGRHVSRYSPSSNGLDRITCALACVFVAELIVGGPGYWSIGGISLRKLFFTLNMVWLGGLWALGRLRLGRGELLLAVGLISLMLLWIVLIPAALGSEQLSLARQDGLPVATALLWVFFGAFFRLHPGLWKAFCLAVVISLALVAVANIVLWALGASGTLSELVIQGIALYGFTLGHLDPAPTLYIQVMPDGFFRVLWITGTLYVPALLYCIAYRRPWGAALFVVALLATYTRGLWLGALMGILIAQLLSRPGSRFVSMRIVLGVLALSMVGGVALLLSAGATDQDDLLGLLGYRVSTTFSDSSADERFEQVGPLLDAWEQARWFGKGFGAQAALIRSEEAVFLYEITGLALLMKLGIVGMAVIASLLGAPWVNALRKTHSRNRAACAGLAGIAAFMAAATTNPYLMNFVGMSVVGFMFVKLHVDQCQQQAEARIAASVERP